MPATPLPSSPLRKTDHETATLREQLARGEFTAAGIQRTLCDLATDIATAETSARRAESRAEQSPHNSSEQLARAAAYRRNAAIARAKTDLLYELIGGHRERSHTHTYTEHPVTGANICTCGMTEIAADRVDPDYITACCGCIINTTRDAHSLVYCFACDMHNRPVIHRDQYQDAICAACQQTSAEAGGPSRWTIHMRTPYSDIVAAQSCGGTCAEAVEAMRDDTGHLALIPNSADGHFKLTAPTD
ncbi:hypothetical protein [Nocardia sp. NPDC004260]